MSYTRPSFLRAFLVEGQRRDLAQGLVGPVAVVYVLPCTKKLVDLGEGGGGCEAIVELLFMRPLGSLDVAVELGRAWWENEELEDAGIARLSLGPALIWASLTVMRKIAVELQNYGSFDLFTRDMITTDEIRQYLSKEPMR